MKQFENSGYLHLNAQEKTALHNILSILIDTAKPSLNKQFMVDCVKDGIIRLDSMAYTAVNTFLLKLEQNG